MNNRISTRFCRFTEKCSTYPLKPVTCRSPPGHGRNLFFRIAFLIARLFIIIMVWKVKELKNT